MLSEIGGSRPDGQPAPYRLDGDAFDEMVAPDGSVRPHYCALAGFLGALAPSELEQRFGRAAQYLREAGVFYRTGAEADAVAAWPLAHPPLVLDAREWATLETGLVQRARYLEALARDLYGHRRLVTEGVLPASMVGQNPEFLRPLGLQGLAEAPLLRFIAIDLVRSAGTGAWTVVADRTQAPSGAGFALENRVATSRAFPDLLRQQPVRRLAGFFNAFREALNDLNGPEGGRVGLLTPGPHSETYFEHAYLARYLGFRLLEGADLSVRNDALTVRTVDGPSPIRVLWRRLDADYADPLELLASSQIGTPGLVRAVRAGHAILVNALGSGIVETPALRAFEAASAHALLGETLGLPSVPVRWDAASGDLAAVEEDTIRFSTAPTFEDGRLVPRAVTLRVFLARGRDGWSVMPGGFARFSAPGAANAVSMRAGGRSADVWIAGTGTEPPLSLIARPSTAFSRRLPAALPARAADDLYWLGRYVERTEIAARLFRMHVERDERPETPGPAARCVARLLGELVGDPASARPGLATLAANAFSNASRNRERFSPDGWRVLAEIVDLLRPPTARPADDEILADAILMRLAGFAGLVHESMYQFTGWRFLEAGRRVERGTMTAHVAGTICSGGLEAEGVCEALLEFTDARMTYRRRFSVDLVPSAVVDLSILDPLNPRSLAFQAEALGRILDALPGVKAGETLHRSAALAARLRVRLQTAESAEVTPAFLIRAAGDFRRISDGIAERYFGQAGGIAAGAHPE